MPPDLLEGGAPSGNVKELSLKQTLLDIGHVLVGVDSFTSVIFYNKTYLRMVYMIFL